MTFRSGPAGALLGLGAVVFAAALLGIGTHATYGARVSADEPQYLLSALSLGRQGDLDISDEIASEAYRRFHRADLDRQTIPVDAAGRQFSPHDPLLPAILAVPMRIGGWVGARLAMAAMAAMLSVVTAWTAIRRFAVRVPVAVFVTGAFACTAPLATYGTQIYPEVPAALATVVAVALASGPLNRRALVAMTIALTALPWLSVKYTPVAAAVCAVALWRLRDRWRVALAVLVAVGSCAAAYLLVHRRIYGGWTVYASGDYFSETGELSVIGRSPDYAGRSRRLVGLLVDRTFGLGVWMPGWFVLPVAVGAVLRSRRDALAPLLLPAAIGWLVATFVALTMHGWWWPGRQLVVILPLLVIVVAIAADGLVAKLRSVLVVSAVIGLVDWAWISWEATTGRRALIVDFDRTANPLVRILEVVLPDGRAPGGQLTLLLCWAGAMVAAGLAGWRFGVPRKHFGTPKSV